MGTPMRASEQQSADTLGKAKKTNADIKRAFLAISTLGTSEIKTGGGEYGDETVADALFPKTINDMALDERTEARKQTEIAKAAALQPKKAPDIADQLLGAGANSLLRQKTKQGRRSTFLGGGQY